MKSGRASLAVALSVLAVAGCAAHKEDPEILGVDYETHVSAAASPLKPKEPVAANAAKAPAAPAPASATGEASEPVAPERNLRLVEVRRQGDGAGMRLVAQLSRPPSAIHTFELAAPRRCVTDADGPVIASHSQQVLATGDSLAPRLRVGSYADHLRLVLDVEPQAGSSCDSRVDGSAVVIGLGSPPSSATPELVWASPGVSGAASAHAAAVLARAGGAGSPAPEAPQTRIASVDPTTPLPVAAQAPEEAAPPSQSDPALGSRTPERAAPESPPAREGRPHREPTRIASAPPAPAGGDALSPPIVVNDTATTHKYSGRRISLEFKDADILNVLRIIADVAQKNIVATDDVKGRVTIVLRDVPWDQALEILLKSTGLEKVEYDEVITVSTSKRLEEERKARLAAQQAGQQLEPLRTEYIRINYVKAGDLANILQGGASTSGAAAVAAQQIANQAPLGDTAAQRRGLLSSRGSVQVNEATNTLIVRDIADGITNAKELVRRLDVQTPQVAIQGLIFEGDTNVDRSLGIRWGASYKASPETGNPTGSNFPGRIGIGGSGPNTNTNPDGSTNPILVDFPAAGVAPGVGSTLNLLLGSLSGAEQIDAQITALERANKGKVISRPKVITLNNTEATIQSLEILRVRLPSTGTVINTGPGGSAGTSTAATQAIDTGIILRVTPQVSSDGYVLLQLFVKSSVPSDQKTDNIPNEISRQAASQVLVREGETVVIGGVYRQRANRARSGVPWLEEIPVIGWAFKTTDDTDDRQELLVFITPRVVWRPAGPAALPTASELWDNRSLSAPLIIPGTPPAEPAGGAPIDPAGVHPVSAPQG